jgi:predicted ArsR family transcriptional regulator
VPDEPARSVSRLTDPKALRALAHPIRLRLVGVLRVKGQLTATQAGKLLGESSASCSFHLRQLAKYGLVEEAGGGQRRERPWRATSMFTDWSDAARDPELAAAADMLTGMVAEAWLEHLLRWVEVRSGEPAEWQQAAIFADSALYVTAAELAGLQKRIRDLADAYLDRLTKPELRPAGSRLVSFVRIAHPAVGLEGHTLIPPEPEEN